MKIELAKRWVAALRDGSYKQGRGALRTKADNSFCCIGVLCDLVRPEGWTEAGFFYVFDQVGGRLSPTMLTDTGLNVNFESALIAANDKNKLSFQVIANMIEERYMS